MNPFQSIREYEEYIYTLRQKFPSVQRSTLIVIRRGRRVAVLKGELSFDQGYRISVQERLSFDTGSVEIEFYGYELWMNAEKIAWYDAQPHPNDEKLASTHPHHKHIHPDIKHNRIPAPNMAFELPNIPALIAEVEELMAETIEEQE